MAIHLSHLRNITAIAELALIHLASSARAPDLVLMLYIFAIGTFAHTLNYTISTKFTTPLGYPTQKPLDLLERVIRASSNLGDVVLDPFCGCGTTTHAAESLGRRWIGIDISPFSTELVRERIVGNFRHLNKDDARVIGVPETLRSAKALADRDKFEFEKWVCGAIGAHGMYHNPGDRGADGGVDGVMEIDVVRNAKVQREYAIVQVNRRFHST